jgi:hypothetical protein
MAEDPEYMSSISRLNHVEGCDFSNEFALCGSGSIDGNISVSAFTPLDLPPVSEASGGHASSSPHGLISGQAVAQTLYRRPPS